MRAQQDERSVESMELASRRRLGASQFTRRRKRQRNGDSARRCAAAKAPLCVRRHALPDGGKNPHRREARRGPVNGQHN
jgi:hypothetical protein